VGVDRFEIKKMDGSTQTVMVDEHTRYRQGQQDIQLEDLKPGDQVSVRGQANSNKEFVAEAVRRATADEMQRFQNAGERVFGAIESIDKNQLKVSNPRQGERIVLVNGQTQFMKDGQPIALKDLKVGDRIFALGKETQGQFLATRVVTGQFRGPGQRRDNQ
jgi:3-dehydroquinate synthase class II